MFSLKKDDFVIVYYDGYRTEGTVLYFQVGHMVYRCRDTIMRSAIYVPYSFYASGYHQVRSKTFRYIIITKRWHYIFALIAEWVRLNFTNK